MKCGKGYRLSDEKCVLNKRRNLNTEINKKKSILWIIITVIGVSLFAVLFIYGGKSGWFRQLTVVNNEELVNYLELENLGIGTCSLSINPNSISVEDRVTGILVDGKNKFCQVFVKEDNGNWVKDYEGVTDGNGILTQTRDINQEGNYTFRAICDLNSNNRVDTKDCLTNSANLIVIQK